MNRLLFERNALACESARYPKCKCICGGKLHGVSHAPQLEQLWAIAVERDKVKEKAMKKVVSGFVVKLETFTDDPTTQVRIKKRVEVGRVFHSRSAAEQMLELLRKANPNGDYYIHEKTRRDDDAEIY